MSAFLLYHPKTSPTGRQLRDCLGIAGGTRVRGNPTSIIRWGTQREPEHGGVNTPSSLALASDKLRALTALAAAGVRVPEVRTEGGPIEEGTWLGRKRKGFGGTDIQVFAQYTHLPTLNIYPDPIDFYSKYIPNRREYRIHVFDGEVIRVQGKYLDFPDQHTNPHIKNYAQGFRFRTPERQLNSSRLTAATQSVEALGLVFGAVDLLVGEDGLEYVLEVNTAPKLAPLTCSQYAEAIRKYLGVSDGDS